MITTKEALLACAKLLEENGWCRKTELKHIGAQQHFCALGAIKYVTCQAFPDPCSARYLVRNDCERAFVDVSGWSSVTDWNDNAAKDKRSVIRMFRKAARKLGVKAKVSEKPDYGVIATIFRAAAEHLKIEGWRRGEEIRTRGHKYHRCALRTLAYVGQRDYDILYRPREIYDFFKESLGGEEPRGWNDRQRNKHVVIKKLQAVARRAQRLADEQIQEQAE